MLRKWCAFMVAILVSVALANGAMAFQQTPVPVTPPQAIPPGETATESTSNGVAAGKSGFASSDVESAPTSEKSSSWFFSGLPKLDFGLEVLYGDDHLTERYAPEDVAPASESGNFSIKGTLKKQF